MTPCTTAAATAASNALPPEASTFAPSSTATGCGATIIPGMNTSPTHELTEQPVADQLGQQKTALVADRVSQWAAATNRGPNVRSPSAFTDDLVGVYVHGCWVSFVIAFVAIGGCGSKPSATTVVPLRELRTDTQRLSLVAFSPDGKQLAVGSSTGEILVWRDANGSPTALKSGRSSPLVNLIWSPDGLLAATDLKHRFFGWQFGGAMSERVDFPQLASVAVCLAFRPNTSGRELVLGLQDGSLMFVDKNGTKQFKPEHRGPVKQALYSLDGKWLITAGADGKLIWRDAVTRQIAELVKAADTDISRLLLAADGKQFVSGDWNGTIKVWDTTTRKPLRQFEQPEAVSGLGWIRGELVSAGWDGTLLGWELSSGRCLRSLAIGRPVHELATNSEMGQIATVSLDGAIQIWDWKTAIPK